MRFKDGVIVGMTKMVGNEPILLSASQKCQEAMMKADIISRRVSGKEIVVTSLLDGVHSKNSLHYTGNAFDLRVWIYTVKQKGEVLRRLKDELGSAYDCIDEGDHLHIEYDPK